VKKWPINQKRRRIRSKLKKNLLNRKNGNNQRKKNYKRERTRTLSTNNRNNYELKKGIDLLIKEKSDATNKNENDNNDVKR
jgi:hypothetical protein